MKIRSHNVGSAAVIALALVALLLPDPRPAAAQRRRARPEPAPAPATLTLTRAPADLPGVDSPYRFVVRVEASETIELSADRRLLELSILAPGERRPSRCRSPEHPSRPSAARARTLSAGQHYEEWIDLRELCWGRSLRALRAGGQVRATFGFTRRGRGRAVVRRSGPEGAQWATLEAAEFTLEPAAAPVSEASSSEAAQEAGAQAAAARVSMRDVDARSQRFSLRVSVRGQGAPRRVWLRPDHVSFVVRGPEGEHRCSIDASGARPIPDLFRRLGGRAAVSYSLDVRQYCDEDVFRSAGIYEVVPVLDLDEDGSEWDLDALTGHFEGEPALVRVRRDARGYVERSLEGGDA